jgi:membrane protease YdiL (CAAX protease family)
LSIGHAFAQFADPLMVLSGFSTLFLIGWILADARLRTHSLALPMGLHGGWIFGSQLFSKVARRQMIALPWIGKSLLIGIVPLGIAALSWTMLWIWLKRYGADKN